jgi:hypothetical protein
MPAGAAQQSNFPVATNTDPDTSMGSRTSLYGSLYMNGTTDPVLSRIWFDHQRSSGRKESATLDLGDGSGSTTTVSGRDWYFGNESSEIIYGDSTDYDPKGWVLDMFPEEIGPDGWRDHLARLRLGEGGDHPATTAATATTADDTTAATAATTSTSTSGDSNGPPLNTYIDRGTRAVQLNANLYSPSTDLFATVVALFEFTAGGAVVPALRVRVYKRVNYDDHKTWVLLMLDLAVLLFFLRMTWIEAQEIRKIWRDDNDRLEAIAARAAASSMRLGRRRRNRTGRRKQKKKAVGGGAAGMVQGAGSTSSGGGAPDGGATRGNSKDGKKSSGGGRFSSVAAFSSKMRGMAATAATAASKIADLTGDGDASEDDSDDEDAEAERRRDRDEEDDKFNSRSCFDRSRRVANTYMMDLWNTVDLLTLGVYYGSIGWRLTQFFDPIRKASIATLNAEWVQLNKQSQNYSVANKMYGVVVLLSLFQMLKFAAMSTKVNLMWLTVHRAISQLGIFLVFFCTICSEFSGPGCCCCCCCCCLW